MDQETIGRFIASSRKEAGMTQAMLAEKLGITDRAVSKWENGRSMPDVSLMLPLCGLLGINVNELLSGEHLEMDNYKEKAEENLLQLKKNEEKSNRRLAVMTFLIEIPGIAVFLVLLLSAVLAVKDRNWQIVMLVTAGAMLLIAVISTFWAQHNVGYYECLECGKRYIPSWSAVIFAPHIGWNRIMRCPYCRKIGLKKKVLTK
jgi:transcriptional regulator with XRE-family HTH domain/predicted RNA-binding Zn-ribbon protein involved in translation (DUF1610 family)